MYSFINSVSLSKSLGSQWEEIDLSNIPVNDIYNTYQKVYLILSNPVLPNNIYVDIDSLKLEFSNYTGTLSALLVVLSNRTLETVPTLPNLNINRARYSDAYLSEYKIDLCQIGMNLPDNFPSEDKHDLAITRPKYKTQMSLLHDYCLLSVNGYYHMTAADTSNKAYAIKGADSLRICKQNHLGILSFLDIGKLTKIPLDISKIYSDINGLLKNKIYFDITQSLAGKSYFLVLGGYLIFPQPNIFWATSNNSFALNIQNIEYLEKIYESQMSIDLSDLQLTKNTINPHSISIEEIYSDDVIKRYLTLSQSFLVIVDTPNILTNKVHIRHSSLPGMFTAYNEPTCPLIIGHGKTAEYWKVLEDGYWAITVQDSFYRNYILSESKNVDLIAVTNNLTPGKVYKNSRGFLLDIQSYN